MRLTGTFAGTLCLAALAQALPAAASDNGITASFDAGLLNLKSTETVKVGGHTLSKLDWETKNATALRGSLGIEIAPDWRIRAEGRAAFEGNGSMTDYDWIPPFYTSSSSNGWSHRSQHPDTRLDHYFAGSLELNRVIFQDPTQELSLGIGARYTDLQWSAYGGNYIYSVNQRRDTAGSFNNGEKVITYRQQVPVLYANLTGSQEFGRWTLTGGLEGGAMVRARATDDHWLRDMRFTDKFDVSGMFGVKAGIAYKLTPNASLYLDGAYERTTFGRGDTDYSGAGAGEMTSAQDVAGGDMQSLLIGLGVRGKF